MKLDQREYEIQERIQFNLELDRVESQSLADRRAAKDDFANALNDLEVVERCAEFIIAGHYGAGPYHAIRGLSKRSNRAAILSRYVAALEFNCPAMFAVKAWKELPEEQQNAVNDKLNELLEEMDKETA